MENITINDIMYAVITVVLPMLLRFVYQLVSAKVTDEKASAALSAVYQAVTYVNQTFVDSLKKSGNFDAEAQKAAFLSAKDAAMGLMDDATIKFIKKSYGDIDKWLDVQIEAAVKDSKQ